MALGPGALGFRSGTPVRTQTRTWAGGAPTPSHPYPWASSLFWLRAGVGVEDRRKRGEGPHFYCVLSPDLLRHQALRATSHLHGTPGPCRVGDQETANYRDSGVIMASIFSALTERLHGRPVTQS